MQQLIDRGLKLCDGDGCEAFGWQECCGSCGRRYIGADLVRRDCPGCKAVVVTDYCTYCGEHVAIEFLKRMERGEVDWLAEAEQASAALARVTRGAKFADLVADDPSGRATAIAAVFQGLGGSQQ